MRLEYTMHDGNFRIWYLVDCDVTSLIPCIRGVGKEEKVSTVEGGFHGTTGLPACQTDDTLRRVETRTSARQRWATRC